MSIKIKGNCGNVVIKRCKIADFINKLNEPKDFIRESLETNHENNRPSPRVGHVH